VRRGEEGGRRREEEEEEGKKERSRRPESSQSYANLGLVDATDSVGWIVVANGRVALKYDDLVVQVGIGRVP